MVFEETGQDVKSYIRVKPFLKKKSLIVQPKKASIFTAEEVRKFLGDADDFVYLPTKVSKIYFYGSDYYKNSFIFLKIQCISITEYFLVCLRVVTILEMAGACH